MPSEPAAARLSFCSIDQFFLGYFLLEDHERLKQGLTVENGPKEGDSSAWEALTKGKVWLPG